MSAAVPTGGVASDSLYSGAEQATIETGNGNGPTLVRGLLGHIDNTPLHVAVIVLAALGVVFVLHIAGFRFILDAGVRSR